jgi:hypothetical protein
MPSTPPLLGGLGEGKHGALLSTPDTKSFFRVWLPPSFVFLGGCDMPTSSRAEDGISFLVCRVPDFQPPCPDGVEPWPAAIMELIAGTLPRRAEG